VGNYQISLTAKNNFGCENTIVKSISPFEQYLDVAILDIITTIQNNYLVTSVIIANIGNTDVTSMELYATIKDGPMIKENWSGILKAASINTIQLNSAAYLEKEKDFICVSVLKPNTKDDEIAENNKLCKAINDNQFKALDPYPNPSNDDVTFTFIIPNDKNLTITIYDMFGSIVRNAFSTYLTKGLQTIEINTVELTSGMYACKMQYEGQTVVKTFIKQ
jgi:hypothetical protein